jgi:putative heme-binding domain-containing protein
LKFFLTIFLILLLGSPHLSRAQDVKALGALIGVLKDVDDPVFQRDILKGISDALKGQRNVKPPKGWDEVAPKLNKSPNKEVRQLTQSLSLTFGSRAAMESLREVLINPKGKLEDRRKALSALIDAHDSKLPDILQGLLKEKAMRREAIRGLGVVENSKTPTAILKIFDQLDTAGKHDALTTLATRVSYAKVLMVAIEKGEVKANTLPADIVQQLKAHGKRDINSKLDQLWGVSRSTPEAKLKEIVRYKKLLEAKPVKPINLSRGRALYQRTCAQCHKLYGEGGEIGPDITGSNRSNLDYLLTNILDPNAEIPNDYRTTILKTSDNRVLVGVIIRSEGGSVTIATPAESLTIAKSDIVSSEPQNFSMMPEGLVLAFKEDELHDLVAYLRGNGQVPLLRE